MQPQIKNKKAVVVVVVLAFLIAITLLITIGIYSSGLSNKTITNGGYTYSFKFYKLATSSKVNGMNGESYSTKRGLITAVAYPSAQKPLTNCSELGSQWTQATSVSINGSSYPICTNGSNAEEYATIFTQSGKQHQFSVDYPTAQDSSIYPKLQTIFGSITVKQD
jgi:hypothetical protein